MVQAVSHQLLLNYASCLLFQVVEYNDGANLDELTIMSRRQATRRRRPPKSPKAAKGPNPLKGPKGRPRNILSAEALEKLKPKQQQKYQQSQLAAARYQRNKADKEIERRLKDGEDPVLVRDGVFAKVTAHYVDAGQEVPRMIQTWMGVSQKEMDQTGELDDVSTAGPNGNDVAQSPATIDFGPTSDPPPLPAQGKPALTSAHLSLEKFQQIQEFRISPPPGVAGQDRTPCETAPSMNVHYFPSKSAHTFPVLNVLEDASRPLKRRKMILSRPTKSQMVVPAVLTYVQETSYQKQAESIKRHGCGIFVGKITGCPRKSNQRGRTKNSRLAIIKSGRLNEFAWFQVGEEISEGGALVTSERPIGPSRTVSIVANSDAAKCILLKLAPKPEPKSFIDPFCSEEMPHGPDLQIPHCDPPIEAEATFIHQPEEGTAAPSRVSGTEAEPRIVSKFIRRGQDSSGVSEVLPMSENAYVPLSSTNPENETKALDSSLRPISADPPANEETSKKRIRSSVNSRRPAFIKPVTMSGGSMGVLRRKIIMEIIGTCGGVFPGVRELLLPFITAWHKLDKTGKPDARTLQTALNYLVGSAKIRQITFTFQTNKGLMITRTMLVLAEIGPSDPKVKDMQRKIEEIYPSIYLPPEAEFDETLRTDQSYVAIYGRHKVVQETQEPIQMKTMYAYDLKNQAQAAKYDERLRLKTARERATQIAQTGIWVRKLLSLDE